MNNFRKVKEILRKSIYFGVVVSFLAFVVSCEEDFADLGSNVISNLKFDTNSIEYDVTVENSPLTELQTDNITRQPGQYLLGVYNNPDYEKLEASIVSQLAVTSGLRVVDRNYGADTTVVTKIDTVYLKIPYQATLNGTTGVYEIDSVFGDILKPFNLNVYRSNTFMNEFNPLDPTKRNSYKSNDVFEKIGTELNSTIDYPFIPNESDTIIAIKRRSHDDSVVRTDTVKITFSITNTAPIPFGRVPLDKAQLKSLLLDKLESSEFESQAAFNNYFRGIILEATGNEGSLLSLNLNNTNTDLIPSIEIYYTNTVLVSGNSVDTIIHKNNSFPFSGFKVNTFKMDEKTYPNNNEVKIQGTAGSEGKLQLLTPAVVNELRSKDWLINDATITMYINQSADTSNVPERLYLYKSYNIGTSEITSQIKDAYTEANFGGIGGNLNRDDNGKKDHYTFNITDYISDIVSGEINNFPDLKVKAYNRSDEPFSLSDTIFTNFSWNPKTVTLFNSLNSSRKPVLKISYSERK